LGVFGYRPGLRGVQGSGSQQRCRCSIQIQLQRMDIQVSTHTHTHTHTHPHTHTHTHPRARPRCRDRSSDLVYLGYSLTGSEESERRRRPPGQKASVARSSGSLDLDLEVLEDPPRPPRPGARCSNRRDSVGSWFRTPVPHRDVLSSSRFLTLEVPRRPS